MPTATISLLLQWCLVGAYPPGEQPSPMKSLCTIETILSSRTKPNIFTSQLLLYTHIFTLIKQKTILTHTNQIQERKIQQHLIFSNQSKSSHLAPTLPIGDLDSKLSWPPAPAHHVSVGKNEDNTKHSTELSHHKQKTF